MPSLGFLKKKRTKDDLSSPASPTKHQVSTSASKLGSSTKESAPLSNNNNPSPTVSRTVTANNNSANTAQTPIVAALASSNSNTTGSINSSSNNNGTNNNTASPELTPPTTADSAKASVNDSHKHTDSMQSNAFQPQQSYQQQQQQQPFQHQSTQQHSQNAASINNIINPPSQNDPSLAAASSNGAVTSPLPSQPTSNPVRETKGKYTLTDFTISRTLGTGSFGRVHLVQSKHNQRFYAVKVLKKAQVVKMKQVEHTNDERRMLQKVKHPFLITLWGTFQDSKNLYMVMDFIEGGELFSLLRKSQVRTRRVECFT